ncbi:MAG: efflux RND transporter periplasmic adaptor subunit, partial [Chloroflexota bacterium]|nr:efflux RND transporter periplasmic adaptor subunit [Chloroflexota bacterium]
RQPYVATDFQSAQANVDAATAQLQAAKVNQQQAIVYAPFDGVISARLRSEGALASPSAPIFTIISRDVEIDIPVGQEQIGQVKDGQAAQLTTPAFASQTINGKILTIAPAADPKSRSFMVRVVPAGQDGKLKPGMSAAITLVTSQKTDAVLIPKDAVVVPSGGKPGVYIVRRGPNGLSAAFVTPVFGISNDQAIEVVSGLNPDDEVVVQGQASLSNNQPIRLLGAGGPGPAPSGPAGAGARAGAQRPSGTGQPGASGRPGAGSRPGASGGARPSASASRAAE